MANRNSLMFFALWFSSTALIWLLYCTGAPKEYNDFLAWIEDESLIERVVIYSNSEQWLFRKANDQKEYWIRVPSDQAENRLARFDYLNIPVNVMEVCPNGPFMSLMPSITRSSNLPQSVNPLLVLSLTLLTVLGWARFLRWQH